MMSQSSGLDPVTSAKIDELIVQMQKLLGVTSIVVTHDMKSAFYIADRIAMLYQGEMIAIGTPDEIRNSTDSRVLEFINVSQIRKEVKKMSNEAKSRDFYDNRLSLINWYYSLFKWL